MSERLEFIVLASREDANVSELCRRYGISRKTGNKWLCRFREEGEDGLRDRSRRPKTSPARVEPDVERDVLELRAAHPAWGGRKLRARLQAKGRERVPAASTITAILDRNGQLAEPAREQRDWQRFEHEAPNRLWQMDFKGHFAMERGRCNPLTVLDDHSRFSLCLQALPDQREETVRQALISAFRLYVSGTVVNPQVSA
jgi:transposase InsO family protein